MFGAARNIASRAFSVSSRAGNVSSSRIFSSAATQEPVFVIFGANGGIGSSLAAQLKEKSAAIVLAGRNVEKLNALQAQIGAGTVIQCDPLNASEVDNVITQVRWIDGERGRVVALPLPV